MKPVQRLLEKISKTSFVTKLFLSYLAIVLIPLFLLVTINYYRSVMLSKEQALYSNEKALTQTAAFIEYKASSIKNIINVLIYDDTIQKVLTTSKQYDREYISNWIIQKTTAKNIIYNAYISNDINSLRLYTKDGATSIEETTEFKTLTPPMQDDFRQRLEQNNIQNSIWIPYSFFKTSQAEKHISLVKRIPNLNSINKYIGVIKAEIPQSIFEDILNQTSTTVNTSVVLFNAYDEVIASAGHNAFLNPAVLNKIIAENTLSPSTGLKDITYENQHYLMGLRAIENTDWRLAVLIPNSDILAATNIYRKQMLLIVLILLIFSIPIIYFTSRSLTLRLRLLKHHMNASASGNFDIPPLQNGNDEIGDLTRNFNYMLTKIAMLLDEQYKLGYEIKNLELKVLQSQINPHFLYNTLDMIYWLAVKNKVPEISSAAKALGGFYKLSLGHGEDIVTIEKELAHVEAYVSIQNMRFENNITLSIDVPEVLHSYTMIKIILQPLVENAILHGIREREDGKGTIAISGKIEDMTITLVVSDNGIGMDQQQADSLLAKNTEKNSYGIWNINERLHLHYGEPYGLSYKSVLSEGTQVTITFPAVK
jgi:two-component system sensor histidine kinase YesM